ASAAPCGGGCRLPLCVRLLRCCSVESACAELRQRYRPLHPPRATPDQRLRALHPCSDGNRRAQSPVTKKFTSSPPEGACTSKKSTTSKPVSRRRRNHPDTGRLTSMPPPSWRQSRRWSGK